MDKPKIKPEPAPEPTGKINKREITTELRDSYLDYAMSVIVGRALPDVRDGLKPVHRRILWAMWDDGLTHTAKLRKSATVVGTTLGRYHPHGDQSVYDAMTRMAQDFSLRYPLIQGQGNWGCFTGDTKIKLTDGRDSSFKELIKEHKAGKQNYTYTFNHQTERIEVAAIEHPRLTRKKAELVEVTLDNNEKIKCTPDHRFMMRDGSYKEAKDLINGDSLMPGYFRLSTKEDDTNIVGYTMVHQPISNEWVYAHHLSDELNLKHNVYARSAGRIRHHKDINKLNNDPTNIVRLDWKAHWKIHYELASWRHHNDPAYVEKIAAGRNAYIETHREVFAERARNLNKKLWKSKKFRERHAERIATLWNDPIYKEEMRALSSRTLKKTWENPEYQSMMSKLKSSELKARWQDPIYQAYWSDKTKEISKKIWATEGHREYISRLGKQRMSSPEAKAKQSQMAKDLWQNSEYRSKYQPDHFSKMAKALWDRPESIELHRAKAKAQWQDSEFRDKITSLAKTRGEKKALQNPEHFKKMAEKAKVVLHERWQDPEYKKRVVRSKVLGYANSLLGTHKKITPDIYEASRKSNGVPTLANALSYFENFDEIIKLAPTYNHKVIGVSTVTQLEDVYDLTISGTHNFLLASGIFVHNSIDGDNAAAMRYTECRLSKIAEEMLTDIDKDTVDFIPNYDGSRKEPVVMPSKIPNLLINGSDGIAVGMATKIPPHNLTEILNATEHLIDNPEATSEDMMTHIQGPDFPTGGVIYGKKDIIAAYLSGRGTITVRANADVEEKRIIINDIPYQVDKSELIIKMADLVREKKIEGIRDIRDESDRDGLRIVIEMKNDAIPQKILNQLYNSTDLQKDFHLNMLALRDGLKPDTLSIRDVLAAFIEHRHNVVRRRAEFDLARAKDRAHILEGLVIALENIDKIINTIKKSEDKDDARKNLIKNFKLSALQADAILEMKLSALAALERIKVEKELAEKLKLIDELTALLKSKAKILKVVKDELAEVKEKFGDERRTKVVSGGLKEFKAEDLIPSEETVITMSKDGYIKRLPPTTFKVQKRGGSGIIGSDVEDTDFLTHFAHANTHDNILFFTDRGIVFQTKVYEIPVGSRTAKGKSVHSFLEIPAESKITAIVAYPELKGAEKVAQSVAMVTEEGVVKKTNLEDFENVRRTGIIAIKLKGKDVLKWVKLVQQKNDLILCTKKGASIRFKEADAREMGRAASGVRGIRLKKGDLVSSFDIVPANNEGNLLVVMENGLAKQTPLKEYKIQGRGGSGILTAKITPKTGDLISAHVLTDEEELLSISVKGQILKTEIKSVRKTGRSAQGVRIMRLSPGDKIAGTVCL